MGEERRAEGELLLSVVMLRCIVVCALPGRSIGSSSGSLSPSLSPAALHTPHTLCTPVHTRQEGGQIHSREMPHSIGECVSGERGLVMCWGTKKKGKGEDGAGGGDLDV